MKKIIVLFFIITITIISLVFYFADFSFINKKRKIEQGVKENKIEHLILEAWIEVVMPKIYEIAESGFVIRELKTGDIIKTGAYLKTDAKGRANIRFLDGSMLRIEENTMTKIDTSKFDEKNHSLVVKVELMAGKIWSKIIELTTPDSIWEVKTSNVVATVRGTAFGMEYGANKKSRIIGSENEVEVNIINPQTKKIILTRLKVGAKKTLEIDNEIVQKVAILSDKDVIKKTQEIIKPKDTPKEILISEWVQRSENEDNKIRQKIEQLKKKGLEGIPLREEIKKEIFEEYKTKIQETRIDLKEAFIQEDTGITQNKLQEIKTETFQKASSTIPIPNESTKPSVTQINSTTPNTLTTPTISNTSTNTTPTNTLITPTSQTIPNVTPPSINFTTKDKLIIITKTTNFTIFEGNTINFEAVLIRADGSRTLVTNNVIWQVGGQIRKLIGTITPRGVFTAKLEEGIAEAGIGYGAVIAIIKNNDLKTELIAKSPYIIVNAKLNTDIISPTDIGGQ